MTFKLSQNGKLIFKRFMKDKRAVACLVLLVILISASLFSELLCNNRPLIVKYNGSLYFPIFFTYPETQFGGDFETETDYHDPFIKELITEGDNWVIFPPVQFDYKYINLYIDMELPAPPNSSNLLGTDDRGRDVLARLVYGFRLSILFGLLLAVTGSITGIVIGALQGYFGGKVDIICQRLIEIWSSMPSLYLLIIFSAILKPSLGLLIILLSLFDWMGLSAYVRAEFLRARNFEYVKAAKALGVPDITIMHRHLLPNTLTPVLTFFPFRITGAMVSLVSLDFLGLGVPSPTPSLGELLRQGTNNLHAWWISIPTFILLVVTITLLTFVGEGFIKATGGKKH